MLIDANIFLRHLLDDHPEQSPACHALIRQLESATFNGWTSDLVIAEIVFVLSAPNRLRAHRERIAEMVFPLTQLMGLQTPSKSLWPRVFDLYASTSIDFIDAYNAALVEQRGETEVMTYDHDFDGLAGLERREPPSAPA